MSKASVESPVLLLWVQRTEEGSDGEEGTAAAFGGENRRRRSLLERLLERAFFLLKWGCTDDCTVIGAAAAAICSFPYSASLVASRGNDHDHGGGCCCCCCGDVLLETADLVRELLGCCHFSFLRVNWLKIEDNLELYLPSNLTRISKCPSVRQQKIS